MDSCLPILKGMSRYIFFFKQKTAYEIVDCDWSSDVCSSDLLLAGASLVDAATFAARVGAFAATGNGAQPSYPTTASTLPEVTNA